MHALRLDAAQPWERQVPPEGRVMRALRAWVWSEFRGTAFLVFERAEARLRTLKLSQVTRAGAPGLQRTNV